MIFAEKDTTQQITSPVNKSELEINVHLFRHRSSLIRQQSFSFIISGRDDIFENEHFQGVPGMDIKVILEKDEDGYFIATVPALPGCISQGKTERQALKNIKEAIELHV